MALQVWLPLNGDLHNQGLNNITFSAISTNTVVDDNGKIGKCYNNNSNTAGGLISNKTINLGTNQSMFCWVNFTSLMSGSNLGGGLVSQHRYSNNTGMGLTIKYVSATTGYLSVNTGNGSSRTFNTYLATTLMNAGTWYHVGYTYDGSNIKLYVNGVCEKTQAYTGMSTPEDYLTVFSWSLAGSSGNGVHNNYLLKGKLNDVRVYDHCLSTKEVKKISKGLILHYRLGKNGAGNPNILTGTYYNSYGSSLAANSNATNADGKWAAGSGGNGTFSVTIDPTCPVGIYSWNVLNNTSGNRDFQQGNQPYVSDQKYTTSFWAKGNGTCLYRSWNSTDGKAMFTKTWTLTSNWTYYTYTFTASAEMETDRCTFHLGVQGSASINICGMKMELGTIATPYSLALNENLENSIIYDSSGYNNNGINIDGTIYNNGQPRYNYASSFIGTSVDTTSNTITGAQYLYTILPLTTISAITITWWAKVNAYGRGGIFETVGDAGMPLGNNHNTTAIANWDSTFRIYNGSSAFEFFSNFSKDGNWHYRTIVFNGTTAYYYEDGILKKSGALSGTLPAITGFRIGLGRAGGVYRQIDQQVSDFRIYATALSADDILELYRTSKIVSGTTMTPRSLE